MMKSQTRVLEMLFGVRQHGLSRTAAFPANSRGHELYVAVDTSIKNIQRYSAEQATHTHALREKTVLRKVAFEALRKAMTAYSRTARSMSSSTPGMEEKFSLPSNRDAQTWIAFGRGFVTEAESAADEFVRRGMAPDFVDDLKARIFAFEQAVDGQAQASAGQVASTTALAETVAQGLADVRELDAIVRNIYASNEAELAAWESASHVERAPRHAEEEEEEPPAEPPPAQS